MLSNLAAEVRQNLRLITALAAHRVAWVQEVTEPVASVSHDTLPIVTMVVW